MSTDTTLVHVLCPHHCAGHDLPRNETWVEHATGGIWHYAHRCPIFGRVHRRPVSYAGAARLIDAGAAHPAGEADRATYILARCTRRELINLLGQGARDKVAWAAWFGEETP